MRVLLLLAGIILFAQGRVDKLKLQAGVAVRGEPTSDALRAMKEASPCDGWILYCSDRASQSEIKAAYQCPSKVPDECNTALATQKAIFESVTDAAKSIKEHEATLKTNKGGKRVKKEAALLQLHEEAKARVKLDGASLPLEGDLWGANRIPYCWSTPLPDVQTRQYYLNAMLAISDDTNVDFYPVACNVAGHKLKLTYLGWPESWVGIVKEANDGSAVGFNPLPPMAGAVGTAGTDPNTFQTISFETKYDEDGQERWHSVFVAAHELIHTLGFGHMHQRSDSAKFVTIEDSVTDADNCARAGAGTTDAAQRYNCESIMHYPKSSQCGDIKPVEPADDLRDGRCTTHMGQMTTLNDADIESINAGY